MTVKPQVAAQRVLADKPALQRSMEELNKRMGFIPDLEATPEKVRTMMRADGIVPEKNEFSCELLRMRYEE